MNPITKATRLAKLLVGYKQRKIIVKTMPIRFWIESSFACNLKCSMCPNKDVPVAEKGLMSLELFKKIIDEVRLYAGDINIHHRGEPFLNPHLFEMIRYAKHSGLAVRFHSNGCLMDEAKARLLLDSGPDLISFSIDGFDKEAYEEIRIGGVFEKTVENVIRLATLKREGKYSHPYIVVERIDFNKHRTLEHQTAITLLTQQFLDAGVNEVITKAEYNWTTERAPDVAGDRSYSVCTFPWYAMVICADGTVTPCPQDYLAGIPLGNVSTQSIAEVWNGEPYQCLRKGLVRDIDSLCLCRKCDRLCRKQVGGVPFQYLFTFLADQFVGYGKLRSIVGTSERN